MTVAAPACRPASRDHLGSVREVVEASSGGLEARFAYDPWGQPTQVAGTMDVDFAFTGHHYHEKSGFHLAPFREYSAELGRWMSRDPAKENGGQNIYNYCFANPICYYDSKGLEPECPAGTKAGEKFQLGDAEYLPTGRRQYTHSTTKKITKLVGRGNFEDFWCVCIYKHTGNIYTHYYSQPMVEKITVRKPCLELKCADPSKGGGDSACNDSPHTGTMTLLIPTPCFWVTKSNIDMTGYREYVHYGDHSNTEYFTQPSYFNRYPPFLGGGTKCPC